MFVLVRHRHARAVVDAEADRVDVALQQFACWAAAQRIETEFVRLEARVIGGDVEIDQVIAGIAVFVGKAPGIADDVLLDAVSAAHALSVVRLLGGVVETQVGGLETVEIGELIVDLAERAEDVVVAVLQSRAVAEMDVAGIALGDTAEDAQAIDRLRVSGHPAIELLIGGMQAGEEGHASGRACIEVVVGPRRAEGDHAAGAAAAVEGGGGAAQHLGAHQQTGIDEEAAVMARVEILPRTVNHDDHVGPGEAADARDFAGAARTADEFHTRHLAQHIIRRRRLQRAHLFLAHDRHHAGVVEDLDRIARRRDRNRAEISRRHITRLIRRVRYPLCRQSSLRRLRFPGPRRPRRPPGHPALQPASSRSMRLPAASFVTVL